jgi:hypothetical protein
MDQKQQADALNVALGDDIPQIAKTPSTTLELICGYFNDETNSWETSATVRELNGFDEEALAALESKNVVYAEYMTTLLKRAVLTVGSYNVQENPSVIERLIVGDRDLLFLKIIEATYGKIREYVVSCGSCTASNDVSISLDEFKNREIDVDPHEPLKFTLNNGSSVELRLPNGADSEVVTKRAKTTAEQNTLMLARCLVSPKMANPQDWAKNLGLKDRNDLVKKLLESQPGPVIGEVNAQCATCGKDLNIVLDWASLLFG